MVRMTAPKIGTRHIRAALDEAARLAQLVEHLDAAADTIMPVVTTGIGQKVTLDEALERAANLARHAGEELLDEALRYRHGWDVV